MCSQCPGKVIYFISPKQANSILKAFNCTIYGPSVDGVCYRTFKFGANFECCDWWRSRSQARGRSRYKYTWRGFHQLIRTWHGGAHGRPDAVPILMLLTMHINNLSEHANLTKDLKGTGSRSSIRERVCASWFSNFCKRKKKVGSKFENPCSDGKQKIREKRSKNNSNDSSI